MSLSAEGHSRLIFEVLCYLRDLNSSRELDLDYENLNGALSKLELATERILNNNENACLMATSRELPGIFEEFDRNDEKFRAYVSTLKSKGYFDRCNYGSTEFDMLLKQARRNYLNYSSNDGRTESPVSTVGEDFSNLSHIERVSKAESLKIQGNERLNSGKYDEAIDLYSKSIALNSKCAVYYSNRAAAYTSIGDYKLALEDAIKAIELDPSYSKAYLRLGLAYYNMGEYQKAIDEGYQKALDLDKSNQSIKDLITSAEEVMNKGKKLSEPAPSTSTPNTGKNILEQMSQLMSNKGFLDMAEKLMKEPNFFQMAERFINNPQCADMFNELMGDQKLSDIQNSLKPK